MVHDSKVPSFRLAEIGDVATILDLMREFYGLDQVSFNERTARPALSRLIDDSWLGRVWIIEVEGAPIGYLALTFGYSLDFGGRNAFVDDLFIRAEHQGQGIGTAALELAEATARDLGIRVLHLEVDRSNQTTQALYRKLGFKDHNRYLLTKEIGRSSP